MGKVMVETDRLILRAPVMEDIEPLLAFWSDPDTMQYITKDDSGWTREMVEERVKRAIGYCQDHGMTFWTVVLKETGEVIGQGGIVPIKFNGDEIELGYRFGKEHWGKGYASEVAAASVKHAFEEHGLDRLVAMINPDNTVSRKVLEKVGFVEIGESDLYYNTYVILFEQNNV